MGCLFAKEPPPPTVRSTGSIYGPVVGLARQEASSASRPYPSYQSYNTANIDEEIVQQIRQLNIRHQIYAVPSPIVTQSVREKKLCRVKVESDPHMMKMLLGALDCYDQMFHDILGTGVAHTLYALPTTSQEYAKVYSKFRCTLNHSIDHMEVSDIKKNINPYLQASYLLKLKEKEDADELQMFHGTKRAWAEIICLNNFDWRLAGNSVGHIFGQGASFAKRSTYACHYPRNMPGLNRTVVVATVLVTDSFPGDKFTKLPPEGYDSTCKPNGDVIVKYDDAEYFPQYIIYYDRVRPLPKRQPNFRLL